MPERASAVWRYENPCLLLVFGPPGFGADFVGKADPESVLEADWEHPERLLDRANAALSAGQSGLIDCSTATKRNRSLLTRLARRLDVPVTAIVFDDREESLYSSATDTDAATQLRQRYERTRDDLVYAAAYNAQRITRVQTFGFETFQELGRIEFG